jgi:hypothetical protein
VNLPFLPNLLFPFAVDGFYDRRPRISQDGEFAAIGRSRTAWVFVDSDSDWGSEIFLLKLHPLARVATLRIGLGGMGALAVDHRKGTIRLVGYWKDRWHDLQSSDQHPGKWKDTPTEPPPRPTNK